MKKDIEISLKNLQTDYIDLYQMHNVKPAEYDTIFGEDRAYRALLEAKEAGKDFAECLDAMNAAAEKGWQSTKDLVAKIGRASRLGERSRGVLDAGATSCYFIITTIGSTAKSLL